MMDYMDVRPSESRNGRLVQLWMLRGREVSFLASSLVSMKYVLLPGLRTHKPKTPKNSFSSETSAYTLLPDLPKIFVVANR